MSTECRWCAPAPSLWVCSVPFVPAFCPLSCFACRVACEYGFISHFKGVFSAFWGADVCLYRLKALRGLWGFCARVQLGGFGACSVFASILSSFVLFLVLLLLCLPFFLPLCSSFLCLSSCPLLVLSLFVGCCCFFFPYGIQVYTQKERALRVWCVLACPVVCISLSDLFNILGII